MASLGLNASVRVHPLVLFSISDSFIRRSEGQERVVGTLLGTVIDGAVEVKTSYPVPHNENGGQVALDIEYHRTMLELHTRVNPKEVIVGWYSTGAEIVESDALIHEFYSRECTAPIHVAVDTAFVNEGKAIRAWTGAQLTCGEVSLGTNFVEVPVQLRFQEAERVGLEQLTKQTNESLPGDLDALRQSVGRLQALIDAALKYVTDVCDGKQQPSNAIGRYLMDTVCAVPRMSKETFGKVFNDGVQDILLVMYLAQITRTQLALSEKLSTIAMPIA